VTERRIGRRLGVTTIVALVAIAAFAVVGGTGLARGLAKPFKAQYGPGQYTGKVTICHKGHVTIRVSLHAWAAHRDRHGDTMGTCSSAAAKAAKLKKAKHAKATKEAKAAAKAARQAKHAAKHQGSTVEGSQTSETNGPPAGHGNGNGHGKNG
jgi:hypothetical protein